MAAHISSRRLVNSATSISRAYPPLAFLPYTQQRTLFDFLRKKDKPAPVQSPTNPFTAGHLQKKPAAPAAPTRGALADTSIFEDEQLAGPKPKAAVNASGHKLAPRNPETMAAALDPDPDSRRRWERKIAIREVIKRGRLSRKQVIKKQERVLISKSHDFKTSVKKLVPLAKQISGKTVDEAIIQMRFSKKKAAKDVKEHLEYAKNQAIVARGMGLGLDGQPFTPLKIQTKDGKRVNVTDPTALYVSQAWCGKGLYGKTPDFRARGQVHLMKNRTTALSLELKEEATRIRLHNEAEKKARNRKVWVQLPNRPVTAQRQHYSW